MALWDTVWNVHYLRALVIFLISYVVMQLMLFISEKVFLRLAKKTKTNIDDLLVEKTRVPLAVAVMFLGARVAAEALEFSEAVNTVIVRILNSLIAINIAYVIITVINLFIDNWGKTLAKRTKSETDEGLLTIFHRIVNIVMYALAGIYVLNIWGISVGPILASLGIAGIAVAFALQNTLGNIFGGISIIMDKAIRIGDIIQLDDGTLGEVKHVSIRSTKIRTFDNELVTIPNGKLADSKITNWYLPNREVRINVNFGVEYGSNVAKTKKVVMDILTADKKVLKDPAPSVLFLKMSDFSLDFVARGWIEDIKDKLEVKERLTAAIYECLGRNKIGIPFPTRTLYLKK